MSNKTSNYQQQKEETGNGQKKKKWKNQSIVIVNNKTKMIRPITLGVLIQEQKLKSKKGGKKTI